MNTQIKPLMPILALAISFLTSSSFAMDEEQNAGAAHSTNGTAFSSSCVLQDDRSLLLLQCWEGATVSREDPLGIAGPGIRARILREAHLTIGANPASLLCGAVYEAATQVARDILDTPSSPIYITDLLPLEVRTLIASYICDPQNADSIEAENSIVLAGAIRSLAPVVTYTNSIRSLLESSRKRLGSQTGQLDPSTFEGSLSIYLNKIMMQKLGRFDALINNPEQTFFNILWVMCSKYFSLHYQLEEAGRQQHQYISLSFHPHLPVGGLQEFCRNRGIPAKTAVAQCQTVFELTSRLLRQPYRKNRAFFSAHNHFAYKDFFKILPLDDSKRADFTRDQEEKIMNEFITMTLTDAVREVFGCFLQTHVFENFKFLASSPSSPSTPLSDD